MSDSENPATESPQVSLPAEPPATLPTPEPQEPLVVEETPPTPVDPTPEPPPAPTPAPTPEPEIVPQTPIEPPQPMPEPPIATESKVEEPAAQIEDRGMKIEDVADEPVDKTEDRSTKVEDDAGSESKIESTLPVVDIPPPTPPLAPAVHDPKYTKDIPQKVLELTPEEINAARLLWAREHIGAAQAQANRNRTARMNERMSEIEKIVRGKPQISVHEIAKSVGLSEKLTSGYLQKLVHGGRLHATGNSWNRRFF